jgi:hypothetical protein
MPRFIASSMLAALGFLALLVAAGPAPALVPMFRTWNFMMGEGLSMTSAQFLPPPNDATLVVAMLNDEYDVVMVNAVTTDSAMPVWSYISPFANASWSVAVSNDNSQYYLTTPYQMVTLGNNGKIRASMKLQYPYTLVSLVPVSNSISALTLQNYFGVYELHVVNLTIGESIYYDVIAANVLDVQAVVGSEYVVATSSNEIQFFNFTNPATAIAGPIGSTNSTNVVNALTTVPLVWSPGRQCVFFVYYSDNHSGQGPVLEYICLQVDGSVRMSIQSPINTSSVTFLQRLPDRFNNAGKRELFLTVMGSYIGVFDTSPNSVSFPWTVTSLALLFTAPVPIGDIDSNGYLLVQAGTSAVFLLLDVTTGNFFNNTCDLTAFTYFTSATGMSVTRTTAPVGSTLLSFSVTQGAGVVMASFVNNGGEVTCAATTYFNAAIFGSAGIATVPIPTSTSLMSTTDAASELLTAQMSQFNVPTQNWALLRSNSSGFALTQLVGTGSALLSAQETNPFAAAPATSMLVSPQNAQQTEYNYGLAATTYPSASHLNSLANQMSLDFGTSIMQVTSLGIASGSNYTAKVSEPLSGTPVLVQNRLFVTGLFSVFAVNLNDANIAPERRPFSDSVTQFLPNVKQTTNTRNTGQSQTLSAGVTDGSSYFFNTGVDAPYRIDPLTMQMTQGSSLCAAFPNDLQWSGTVGDRSKCTFSVVYNPVYDAASGLLFVFSQGGASNLNFLWAYRAASFGDGPVWNSTVTSGATTQIVPYMGRVYLVESSGAVIRCLDATTGQDQWRFTSQITFRVLVPFYDTLVGLGSDSAGNTQLASFRLNDGGNPIRWTRELSTRYTAPLFTPDGLILFISNTMMHAIRYDSGIDVWQRNDAEIQGCNPFTTSATGNGLLTYSSTSQIVNGMLFTFCSRNSLQVLTVFDVYSGTVVLQLGDGVQGVSLRGHLFGYFNSDRLSMLTGNGGTAMVIQAVTMERFTQSQLPAALPSLTPAPAEKKPNVGAIVGGVIGVLAIGGAVGAGIVLWRRRRAQRAMSSSRNYVEPEYRASRTEKTPIVIVSPMHGPGGPAIPVAEAAADISQHLAEHSVPDYGGTAAHESVPDHDDRDGAAPYQTM